MSLNAENEVSFSIRISNARGQRVTKIDRLGFATHWAYDAGGNLLSLTDAESQTTSYTYNDAGQRITEQYPDHIAGAVIGDAGYGIITFSYDALGRRTVKEDQQGDTTSYNFDKQLRPPTEQGGYRPKAVAQESMLTRVYVGHSTSPLAGQTDADTFTYDRNGRMLSGHKGRYNNTVTFSYDDRGQQIQETLTTHGQTYTVGYQKNELGQTTQLQYPDGSLVDHAFVPVSEESGGRCRTALAPEVTEHFHVAPCFAGLELQVVCGIKDLLLLCAEIFMAGQPDVLRLAETVIALFDESSMFASTDFVDRLCGHLHDVKSIVNNPVFRQRNDLLRRFDVGRIHVHRNGFDRLQLILRKLRKAGDSGLRVVSIGDRFDHAVVQIVKQSDVVLPFEKSLLVDPQSRHRLLFFASLSSSHRAFNDRPSLIPFRCQNTHGAFDGLSRQMHLNGKPLEENCKATTFLGPWYANLLHAMLRTVHSRNARVQNRPELTTVKMPPLTLLSVVVTRQLRRAFRAAKLRARRMLDIHIHLLILDVQRYLRHRPRTLQTKHLLI